MIGMFKSPNHLVMIVLAVSVVQWILYFVSFGSIWKSLRGILGNVLKRFRLAFICFDFCSQLQRSEMLDNPQFISYRHFLCFSWRLKEGFICGMYILALGNTLAAVSKIDLICCRLLSESSFLLCIPMLKITSWGFPWLHLLDSNIYWKWINFAPGNTCNSTEPLLKFTPVARLILLSPRIATREEISGILHWLLTNPWFWGVKTRHWLRLWAWPSWPLAVGPPRATIISLPPFDWAREGERFKEGWGGGGGGGVKREKESWWCS